MLLPPEGHRALLLNNRPQDFSKALCCGPSRQIQGGSLPCRPWGLDHSGGPFPGRGSRPWLCVAEAFRAHDSGGTHTPRPSWRLAAQPWTQLLGRYLHDAAFLTPSPHTLGKHSCAKGPTQRFVFLSLYLLFYLRKKIPKFPPPGKHDH